jgi:hypothetical protein
LLAAPFVCTYSIFGLVFSWALHIVVDW